MRDAQLEVVLWNFFLSASELHRLWNFTQTAGPGNSPSVRSARRKLNDFLQEPVSFTLMLSL